MAYVHSGSCLPGRTEMALIRVANVTKLQSYKRKQTGAQTRRKDDLVNNFHKHSRWAPTCAL